MFWQSQVRWRCQELPHPHRLKPDDYLPPNMAATPLAGPGLGTWDLMPMRHTIMVTRRIAEALVSTFTLRPLITAIGTADPDISIIDITAGQQRLAACASDRSDMCHEDNRQIAAPH